MKDDLEYHLEDPGDNVDIEKVIHKRKKIMIILISIIISIIVIITVALVLYFTVFKKEKESNKEEEIPEYSTFINITTSENKLIKNTFRLGGDNYIPQIGDLNNGKDYTETERDNFDLCIPRSAMKNKTKYTTVLLNIHGGGWIAGIKADVLETCKTSLYKDFIVATMSYTLLDGTYKEYNIFRIIDEITAVIKKLKQTLIDKGFDGNKLELIISGGSAGAHLSCLYGFMIKNPPIPIKFIFNGVAPVTLNPDYWLTRARDDDILDNIEPEDIEKALSEDRLIHMNGNETGVIMDKIMIVSFMNAFLGRPLKDSFDEIFSNIEKKEINKESEKYQELLNKTSYGYPINYVTEESIPTLCLYGGRDEYIGVAQYAQLKKAFREKSNNNITLVYFKYGTHNVFAGAEGEYGKTVMEKFYQELNRYYKNYLNSYKEN